MKGGKASNWQGGIRVNAFVTGGYLPAKVRGTKTDQLIHLCDWYVTFCGLAGIDAKDHAAEAAGLPPVECFNVWPVVSGENNTSPRREIILADGASFNTTKRSAGFGLISGDYKLLVGIIRFAGWTGPSYPNASSPALSTMTTEVCQPGCLFNIKDDPNEYHNLNNTMPALAREMRTRLVEYLKTTFRPDRGREDPAACKQAVEGYGGFWGPWLK